MSVDKQFNVKKDQAAARLVAENNKIKEKPTKSRATAKRVYDREKG